MCICEQYTEPGVLSLYEERLRQLYPNRKKVTYDMNALCEYIDNLQDLSALVFDGRSKKYQPYGKEWIKAKLFNVLSQR